MSLLKHVKALTPSEEVSRLRALCEKQALTIERLRAPKINLPVGAKRKSAGSSFIRMVAADSHGAHQDPVACKAFFNDMEMLKPAEFIHLGDALDCAGFLAQHHVLGVVPECDYTYEQDQQVANDFFDRVEKASPGCRKDLVAGNHEWRVEKEIIKWTLRNPKDSKFVLDLIGPEAVLSLKKRGISYIRPDTKYDGLNIKGTLYRDRCAFRHGMRSGANATAQILADMSCNVLHGHTHRMTVANRETVNGVIVGWCCPCLADLHPLYGMTDPSNWIQGYILQVVSKTGFLTLQIPIVNGISYLQPLVKHLNIQ